MTYCYIFLHVWGKYEENLGNKLALCRYSFAINILSNNTNIYQQTNELRGDRKEKVEAENNFSHSEPLTVLFSNQFLMDLEKIWELKHWIPDPTKLPLE